MSYFTRIDANRFRASEHVSGAWDTREQHIAPALGLLVHTVERDAAERRADHLHISRLSYDIYGTVPVDEITISVAVLRPGRTIELIEATLRHHDRTIVVLRAWRLQSGDTTALADTPLEQLPAPNTFEPWDATSLWPGGFIASVEVRRDQKSPGRARFWVRTNTPLIADESVSNIARFAGLFDIANGMTVRAAPSEIAFPNVDLTAHFLRQPRGDWVGFDTNVSFGPGGLGLTNSILHDEAGPVGTLAQSLTVRPINATIAP